jgi:hypothetical protein
MFAVRRCALLGGVLGQPAGPVVVNVLAGDLTDPALTENAADVTSAELAAGYSDAADATISA